jgi:peroxiredoxin
MDEFSEYGVEVFSISKNDSSSHSQVIKENQFPFTFLCDPNNNVAREFGCCRRVIK